MLLFSKLKILARDLKKVRHPCCMSSCSAVMLCILPICTSLTMISLVTIYNFPATSRVMPHTGESVYMYIVYVHTPMNILMIHIQCANGPHLYICIISVGKRNLKLQNIDCVYYLCMRRCMAARIRQMHADRIYI